MKREPINVLEVEKEFTSIITAVREGYGYVSRFSDGVCVFVNNKGVKSELNGIMFNPSSGDVTRFELSKKQFKGMFNDAILKFGVENYKISDSEIDVIEGFESITHALYAAKTGAYKGYRIKKTA